MRINGLDSSTKWVVTAIVAAVCMVYSRREQVVVPFYVLGALVTAFMGKGLKRILRVARPNASSKRDYGMPSSHGTSAGYLVTSAGFGIMTQVSSNWVLVIYVAVHTVGLTVCALRYFAGHHTVPQLAVGYLFGFAMAHIVKYLDSDVLGGVDSASSQQQKDVILLLFVVNVVVFGVKYTRKWLRE